MRVIVSSGGCYNGISVFQGDFGGVADVFWGGGGVLRRGERGDEGEEADSLRKAAKRWERKCLEKGVAGFMTER